MRCMMPGGIPATEQAQDVCRIQKNKRIFPLLRELGPLLAQHCRGGVAVLKLNHKRFDIPRLEGTVGLYLPNGAEQTLQATDWWQDNKFRTRGLMYMFPMNQGAQSRDFGNKDVWLHEEILHGTIGRCVAWYLMLSYLYYECNESAVPDTVFDMLCARLLKNLEEAQKHIHGHLISEDMLRAGTGFALKGKYPYMVRSSACCIANPGHTVII